MTSATAPTMTSVRVFGFDLAPSTSLAIELARTLVCSSLRCSAFMPTTLLNGTRGRPIGPPDWRCSLEHFRLRDDRTGGAGGQCERRGGDCRLRLSDPR